MTEVQLAKVTAEIARLKEEVNKSEAVISFNKRELEDAWREYGSKVNPTQILEVSKNNIKTLKRQIDFLENVKNGKDGLHRLSELERNISQANEQIASLNASKMAMYGEMALIRYLKELIK